MSSQVEKIVAGLEAMGCEEIESLESYRVFKLPGSALTYWFVTKSGVVRLNTFYSMKGSAKCGEYTVKQLADQGDEYLRRVHPRIQKTSTGLIHRIK